MKWHWNVWLMVGLFTISGLILNASSAICQSNTEKGSMIAKGLRVAQGELIGLQDGKKIQQWDVENVSKKPFNNLQAIIYLYDKDGKKVGDITKKYESLEPGWHWSFTIEVQKTTSKTKLFQLTGK